MTVLTFPSSPTLGQVYNAPNGLRYVYDGVKWVVETTTSTSEAVTNSTQDRVAPMFVDGDNTGITFAYNSETNTISAAVTAVNGDSLVNGAHTFTLESDGTLSLDSDPFTSFSGNYVDLSNKPTIPVDVGDLTDTGNLLGGAGDRLTNGLNEAILNSDGSITLPTLTTVNWEDGTLSGPTLQMGNDPTVTEVVITGPAPTNTNASAKRIIIQGQEGFGGENNNKGSGSNVYIWAGAGGDGGAIDPKGNGGDVELRSGPGGLTGGDILIESGGAQAENGAGGQLDLNAGNANNIAGTGGSVNILAGSADTAGLGGTGGNVNIRAGAGDAAGGIVEVNTQLGSWQFRADGSLAIGSGAVNIATNNWGITAPVSVNTVVYTAKQSSLASIRAHATIEGTEDGDTTGRHSQACDMMIVRRQADSGASTVDSVVYGVIYTGTGPLATLDAQWNALTSKIEITATPISTTNDVYVKIYATEVARGD